MSLRFPATLLAFLGLIWLKAINPAASGFNEPDFFWHLAYGQWIIEHMALPAGDFMSWTKPGEPYLLTQWLGEVAIGFAYNEAGLYGTRALAVLLTGITVGFAWLGAKRFLHTVSALILAVLCNLALLMTPMRPQLFSFALLSVATWLVVSFIQNRDFKFLYAYPPLMALWINLHGGFVTGLILIGLLATGLTGEAFFDKQLREQKGELGLVWAFVVLSFLATLLNPYGFASIQNVFLIAGLKSSSVISEWQPVNFLSGVGWFYVMILAPYLAIMMIANVKPRLTHGLIAGFFLFFGYMANRQVMLCGAVMAPMTAALLAQAPQYRAMLVSIRNPERPIVYGVVTLALAWGLVVIAPIGNRTVLLNQNQNYPVNATLFLEEHGLTDRVITDIHEASWLIHRGIPVFIDGRMDFYLDPFFFEWAHASRAEPGWDALLEKYRPTAILTRKELGIRQAALASGLWKEVFVDEKYSVLAPVHD